ncbi:hypothetical protein BC936DRAFT_141282 [Jimgerdemannia flammicorona]|uniref:Uncharacterized protein n=1 Tax=Jimgerdemannia flammicorona TaxID=994334 RepID=A0A433DG97_9FUNG|nr:hypothetical protein BC936DRAFT_141282 [Jimgerdemannia flammicorona]
MVCGSCSRFRGGKSSVDPTKAVLPKAITRNSRQSERNIPIAAPFSSCGVIETMATGLETQSRSSCLVCLALIPSTSVCRSSHLQIPNFKTLISYAAPRIYHPNSQWREPFAPFPVSSFLYPFCLTILMYSARLVSPCDPGFRGFAPLPFALTFLPFAIVNIFSVFHFLFRLAPAFYQRFRHDSLNWLPTIWLHLNTSQVHIFMSNSKQYYSGYADLTLFG